MGLDAPGVLHVHHVHACRNDRPVPGAGRAQRHDEDGRKGEGAEGDVPLPEEVAVGAPLPEVEEEGVPLPEAAEGGVLRPEGVVVVGARNLAGVDRLRLMVPRSCQGLVSWSQCGHLQNAPLCRRWVHADDHDGRDPKACQMDHPKGPIARCLPTPRIARGRMGSPEGKRD